MRIKLTATAVTENGVTELTAESTNGVIPIEGLPTLNNGDYIELVTVETYHDL